MTDLSMISLVIAGASLFVSFGSLWYARSVAKLGEEGLKIEKKRESRRWYANAIISDLQVWKQELPNMTELRKKIDALDPELQRIARFVEEITPPVWVVKQAAFWLHKHRLKENYNIALPEKDLWDSKQIDELIDYMRQTVLVG